MHNRFYDSELQRLADYLAKTIEEKVAEAIKRQQEDESKPFVKGIRGLANYLDIGISLAQELKNNNEITYSQRGRELWFRKSEIDKFLQKYKAKKYIVGAVESPQVEGENRM